MAMKSRDMAMIPKATIAPRYEFGTDWKKYIIQLEKYFAKNSIEKDRKSAVLMVNICSKTYTELKRLCHPRKPNALQYDELCTLLGYYVTSPTKILPYIDRIVFYKLVQVHGEPVSYWLERVKSAAVKCNFGKFEEHSIKDRFVTGLARGPARTRLCREYSERTLNELLDIAMEAESNAVQNIVPTNERRNYV